MATIKKLHKVTPGPQRHEETVVGYYEYAAKFFKKHFGLKPVRYTFYMYMANGYPVAKHGPRVAVPIFKEAKRPMTTKESMERFLTIVRRLERQHNRRYAS